MTVVTVNAFVQRLLQLRCANCKLLMCVDFTFALHLLFAPMTMTGLMVLTHDCDRGNTPRCSCVIVAAAGLCTLHSAMYTDFTLHLLPPVGLANPSHNSSSSAFVITVSNVHVAPMTGLIVSRDADDCGDACQCSCVTIHAVALCATAMCIATASGFVLKANLASHTHRVVKCCFHDLSRISGSRISGSSHFFWLSTFNTGCLLPLQFLLAWTSRLVRLGNVLVAF